jgi:hypothetical protein
MRSLVCAQCHVEYYFGENNYLIFPWDKGYSADAMEATKMKWTYMLTGFILYPVHQCLKPSTPIMNYIKPVFMPREEFHVLIVICPITGKEVLNLLIIILQVHSKYSSNLPGMPQTK